VKKKTIEKGDSFMKKNQFVFGWVLFVIAIAFASYVNGISHKLGLFTVTGLGIGYVMQRSRFGFAGIVRKMYIMGNGDLPRAVLFLLSISLIVVAAVQYNASIHDLKIPGMSSVKVISMLTVIGAFIFGIGMMFAGGCASGTLTDIGEGYVRAIVALIFFCIGSVIGVAHLDTLKQTVLAHGVKVYLPDYIGYFASISVFLVFYGLMYLFVRKYEAKRKAEGTFVEETYEDWEKPMKVEDETKFNAFDFSTYHTFFVKRWSFYTGGVMLTVMFLVVLMTTGKNWGVSTTFTYWGAWILQWFGVDVSGIGFFQTEKAIKIMQGGFIHDAGSVRNLGIMIGTVIASLLAGGLEITKHVGLKQNMAYIIGGLFMGYGARLGSGCNIGAFYSALSSMSLSGIVFGFFLILGGIVGLKLVDKFKL
jgi:uncharacterized membrane protein YedE/YeeE